MRDTGRPGGLRFKPEGQAATSGQLGPKSKKRTAPKTETAGETPWQTSDPSEASPPVGNRSDPAPPDTKKRKLQFEDEATPDTASPPKSADPATSGQLGPKSGKLRQDGKRMEKSKLRMEKSGETLNTAREKLANQKPQKKPGPIKNVSRAAGYQSWRYVHGKIHQVEHENVGTEAAHKTELAGEHLVRGGTRFIKHRIRTRPARQVGKWENRHISARADYTYRQLVQENPGLQSNPVSRFWQKQQLKKQYRKQAKEAAKQGKKAVRFTEKVARTVAAFVKRNPKVLLLGLVLFLLIVVLQSCMAGITTIGNGLISVVGGTSYGSSDNDIEAVEESYTALEKDLRERLSQIESDYPNYDEYLYSVDEIGHDPFELTSYLTAKYDGYTPAQVQAELQALFGQQYILTITETVEVRYRTETDTWMDENGETHTDTYEVPYDYYILNVSLKNKSLGAVALTNLDPEQSERYAIYQKTKGNRPYLFEGNIYAHTEEYTDYDIPPEALDDPEFAAMIAEAEKYLGYPYVWGGSSPSTSFDCSGFVCWVINQSGVGSEGRTTATGLFNSCSHIPPGEAQPGDLIFFQGTYDTSGASHVGIYVGNGMMIHCGSPIQYTSINTSYWQSHFLGYGRLP